MVMTCAAGMGDALRERLPALWRRIEDAHYSYLETDDSPEKLQQKRKLEDYIIEYLSLVPHECKFGLPETTKVFQRTVNELPDFSAYRAGLGWAALARYAGNLLAQPWRKEYKVIRLYCGYFKHEVEANMVGAESLLHAMGYKPAGAGRLALDAPICPDMVAAISRDALVAQCECQIMCQIWESVWGSGSRVSWADVWRARGGRERASRPDRADALGSSEIYSNIPVTVTDMQHRSRLSDARFSRDLHDASFEEPPLLHPPYILPTNAIPSHMMYPVPHQMHPEHLPNPVMMSPYGVPYYYPVQAPYMVPTPVYAPIKHATNVPINGYPPNQYQRYPSVPTAQLIEFDAPSVYENGKFEERNHRRSRQAESSRRNSTSKSGFSDVSLPSLPRSDTQPALSKAREDGMGTYESWDYVFRNLSSKNQDGGENRSRYSPSLDRDSRTLDRLDREERRAKYQPTTLDLEDGLQALNIDRSYDEDVYRTAKVNESLMRLKQEQELKRAKQLAKKHADERRPRRLESIGHPKADALVSSKVAPDKVKLLTKKDVKDRKEVIRQQSSVNGSASASVSKVNGSAFASVSKAKKPVKPTPPEADRSSKSKPLENGHAAQTSKPTPAPTQQNYDLKAQLIVSLDEPDAARPLQNGAPPSRPPSRLPTWECGTCTYINKENALVCEMCGKSKRGPEIQPLTSGGRECPTCTLVNKRDAKVCDACGTSLEHCPTYI